MAKKKLGRNAPCHCGSGKKYKHCHLKLDRGQTNMEQSPASTSSEETSFPPVTPESSEIKEAEVPMEVEAEAEMGKEHLRWQQFEQEDLNGKVDLFRETLSAGKLEDHDESFEMLTSIREQMDTTHDSKSRTLYAQLVRQLRHEAPKLYQEDAHYYHSNMIDDAIIEGRWESILELLEPFAVNPEKGIDTFFDLMDCLMYHGQIQMLLEVMGRGWQKVMASDDITPWGIDEFSGKLISLTFYHYLESAETPRFDDPVLCNGVAPYGELNEEWLKTAMLHLSSSNPISWCQEYFAPEVDAEQWQNNLNCLLLDFMADQKKRNSVPFSRSEFVRRFLSSLLYEQMVAPSGTQRRSGRGRSARKQRSRRRVSASQQSPLLPTRASLDKSLTEYFQFLNLQLYKAGAVVELLPAYLHFLARLDLIHPTEMDNALRALHPVASTISKLFSGNFEQPVLLEKVETAWSEESLHSLRNDESLIEARAKPPVERSAPKRPSVKPGALQTYTFKVVYQHDRDVWRKIEISESQTLHDLHRAILASVDFDADHLYSFFLSGKAWDSSTEYTSPHSDGRSATAKKIGDLRLRMKQKFLYLFDYGDGHCFEVQLIEVDPDASKNARYPRIFEEHGESPKQYGWGDENDEEREDWEDE